MASDGRGPCLSPSPSRGVGGLVRYALKFRTDVDPFHSLVHRSVQAYAEQMANGSDPAEDEVRKSDTEREREKERKI